MSILAYLVLMVVLLGIGTITASILPTRGARIGLGSVLFLALVVDITWFLAPLIDWSPELGDGAWVGTFALIAVVAVAVAGYYGRETWLPGAPSWTWPSDRDILLLAVVIVLFGLIVFVLPVPFDTDAQGFGYLALTLREGRNYTTLAPWHPAVDYLYSPGYTGLIAHLSARFDLGIHALQLIFSSITTVLFIWLAYDLGNEIEGPRTGRAFLITSIIGTGLITAFMDSHYTALLALLFSLGFITFVLRYLNTARWSDALFAAICLGAVPLSQPDTTIALMIGYAPWLIVIWFARPHPRLGAWLVLVAVIPLVALGIVSPWLISINDLLGSGIESPFKVASSHWRTLVLMHGGLVVAFAAVGALVGLKRRSAAALWMIIWALAILEFSTLGLLEKNIPDVIGPLLKYDYPYSLAWHGPIIPYLVLGGMALVWIADWLGGEAVDRWVGRLAIPFFALAFGVIAGGAVFFDDVIEASKNTTLSIYGAFSSEADVEAMIWLRDNAPKDAVILNHPGPHEADWAPVISERNTVFFRPQPFYRGVQMNEDGELDDRLHNDLRLFWKGSDGNSSELDYGELLVRYGIDYVLVPQIFGNPDSFDDLQRWEQPVAEAEEYYRADLGDAPYLELVYEHDGARVYRVVTEIKAPSE